MKLTDNQRKFFERVYYKGITVFGLYSNGFGLDVRSDGMKGTVLEFIDKNTAKSLYKKGIIKFCDVIIDDNRKWYGIYVTKEGYNKITEFFTK